MIKVYMPNALIQAAIKVKTQHPILSEQPLPNEKELKKLLDRVVAADNNSLDIFASTLLPREISAICHYIPHNKYRVQLNKLVKVLSYRMTNKYYKILWIQWQLYPNSRQVLKILAKFDKEEFHTNNIPIPVGLFVKILESSAPWNTVNDFILKYDKKDNLYSDNWSSVGLKCETPLYHICYSQFLENCSAKDFMHEGDQRIANCCADCVMEHCELILLNFLLTNQSTYSNLKNFTATFEKMLSLWRNPNSGKFPSNQPIAFNIYVWLYNYHEITGAFKNDANWDRRNFWEKYIDRCEVTRIAKHEMVIFYFKNHCATEFEKAGRIYIFENIYFKETVLPYIVNHTTSDTKWWLWNFSKALYNKPHQGHWEPYAAHAINKYCEKE